jgi:tetratricopeptide (TPR) repeat protein
MFVHFGSQYPYVPMIFRSVLLSLTAMIVLANTASAQDSSEDPPDPVAVFNQGQDAHEKGDLKTAIELYQKALKISPEFPEAELQLGNAQQQLGRIDDAEVAFRHAVELRADWPLAITSLGSLLVAKGQYAEASPLLIKAIELDAQNFVALSAMAELLLRTNAGRDQLRTLLDRIKTLTGKASPTSPLWTARGSLENALGDLPSAKKSLSEALKLDAKNKTALFEKAYIALKENDTAGAEETAKILEKLTGNSDRAVAVHARALFNGGKTDEAAKLIDGILNPSKETLELKAAMKAAVSDDPADLEGKLANDPKNGSVLGRLCSLYRVPDPAKALDYCRRASDADPQNIKPAIGYGAALVQAKRYNEAVALFRKLLDSAGDNFTIHGNLATALFQLKRYPEAKVEYQWLAEKQPDLPITYFLLAICHDQLREYLDAFANYQQFIKLADPEKQKLEIDKVNLRLPTLQQQIKSKKGSK